MTFCCVLLQAMAGSKDWSRSTERPWKSRAFTVYGVREGAKYQVRVIACNAAGEGTPGFTEAVFVRNPAGPSESPTEKFQMFSESALTKSTHLFWVFFLWVPLGENREACN